MCEMIDALVLLGVSAAKQDHEVKYYVRREEVDQTRYRVHETEGNPASPARSTVLDRFEQFAGPPVEEGIILDQRPTEETIVRTIHRPKAGPPPPMEVSREDRSRSPRREDRSRSPRVGPFIESPE